MNAFLCTIGVPSISKITLKRRERDIGPYVELTAKQSCTRASHEEKKLSLEASGSLEAPKDSPTASQCNATRDEQISFDEAMALLESDNEGRSTRNHVIIIIRA